MPIDTVCEYKLFLIVLTNEVHIIDLKVPSVLLIWMSLALMLLFIYCWPVSFFVPMTSEFIKMFKPVCISRNKIVTMTLKCKQTNTVLVTEALPFIQQTVSLSNYYWYKIIDLSISWLTNFAGVSRMDLCFRSHLPVEVRLINLLLRWLFRIINVSSLLSELYWSAWSIDTSLLCNVCIIYFLLKTAI